MSATDYSPPNARSHGFDGPTTPPQNLEAEQSVLAEPADQPWGDRMAYVEDPQGNPVMLCAELSAEG